MALWVTKRKIRIARAATVWLIARFVDPDAQFRFVEEEDVLRLQESEGAVGFHARGARYPALSPSGRVAFQDLVAEHCPSNAALVIMGRVVHDADRAGRGAPEEPEAAGLRMISAAFPDVLKDDNAIVAGSRLVYDSLYWSLEKCAHARVARADVVRED